jgi:acetyl-CoA acetyltransferase
LDEPITIAGAYELPPGRYADLDSLGMFREVLKGAMRSWPVGPKDVDGLLTCPSGGSSGGIDIYIHDKLVSELGIRPTFVETVNIGGATFLAMVQRAAMAIRAGRANAVLCVSGGKFLKPSAGGGEMMAQIISDRDLEVPYGTFIPALYALIASQFMAERGVREEDLARVAVSARQWALINPRARMHGAGPISVEDVLGSRMIASPFHLLDCSLPSDGGGAVLVTRADLGRKWAKQPAYVKGYGEYHPRGTISDSGNLSETGATVSGPQAFRQAGLSPTDIDVAQLYDAFSSTPLILLENLGFCAPGTAAAFVESGAIDPGGILPVNTHGGLLSYGHTGDAAGMSLLTEGTFQTMGTAGPGQVPNVRNVLIHCYGGMMFDHATLILGREP